MKKARGKPATAAPPIVGAQEFRRFTYTSELEWSVWAVEAAIDDVASALVGLTGGRIWSKDILDAPRAGNGADVSKMMPIVSVKGSQWVVGYRTVGFYMRQEAAIANEQAAKLSTKLKTRSVAYHREDISGATTYELFDLGRSGGEQGGDDVPDDFPDEAFRELGLVIPACALDEQKGKIVLSVSAASKQIVDRGFLIYAND